MRCVKEGVCREELFERIEEGAKKVSQEEWDAAAGRRTPDRLWDILGKVVRDALQDTFPPNRRGIPEWLQE
eukprot:1712780-Pyramimonas_sp.AAC.1